MRFRVLGGRIVCFVALVGMTACTAENDETLNPDLGAVPQASDVASMKKNEPNSLIGVPRAMLLANDGLAESNFGNAVSVVGDTLIVGAATSDIGANVNQGAVYVFERNGTAWKQQTKIVSDDGAEDDVFGASVAFDGETVLVGATGDDIDANHSQGSVYVFVRNGPTWNLQAKLLPDDGEEGDGFGNTVALSGDTAIVGVPGKTINGNSAQGAVYVFVRNGGTWTQQAKIVAADGLAGDIFGRRLALSGDTALVIGQFYHIDTPVYHGAAYVFVRNGTTWSEQAKLLANDGKIGDMFATCSLEGDIAVLGAPGNTNVAEGHDGAVYVFERNGTTWSQQMKFIADDAPSVKTFGTSVSIWGDTALVGAQYDMGNSFRGAVYAFGRNGNNWTQYAKLSLDSGESDDYFGMWVSLSNTTTLIGAPGQDVGSATDRGAAYVFDLRKANGDACTAAEECSSDKCIDGVCCDDPCGAGDNDPGPQPCCEFSTMNANDASSGGAIIGLLFVACTYARRRRETSCSAS